MIKADIVKTIAQEMNLGDRDALGIVDHIIEAVKTVVTERERLEIRDFGVFQVKQRKPRIGRNPRNKKEYPIAPHKVVTFKAGKNLRAWAEGTQAPVPNASRKRRRAAATIAATDPAPTLHDDGAPVAASAPEAAAPNEPVLAMADTLPAPEPAQATSRNTKSQPADSDKAPKDAQKAADGKKTAPSGPGGEQLTMDDFFSVDAVAGAQGDD